MNLNHVTIPLGRSPRILVGDWNLISVTAVAEVPVLKLHTLRTASAK